MQQPMGAAVADPPVDETAGNEPANASSTRAFSGNAAWAQLATAQDVAAFAAAWLELQTHLVGDCERAVVVLGPADTGPYQPTAWWPAPGPVNDANSNLSAAAELAMAERRGAVRGPVRRDAAANSQDTACIAWPLLVDDRLCGVAALEVSARGPDELRIMMRQLQWGCGWLESLLRRRNLAPHDRLVTVLELLTVCFEHRRFQAAATAIATELATALDCDWVSLGFRRGRHAHPLAFSHSAQFSGKTNLVRGIGAAMDEAIDQQSQIVYPVDHGPVRATRAHAELVERHGTGAVLSVPLAEGERLLGALTVARRASSPFEHEEIALCRHAAMLIGPALDAKRREERWIGRKLLDAVGDLTGRVVGPRHLGLKLIVALLFAAGVYLWRAEGDFRIAADATLEGAVQRVVAAPIGGYIAQAHARAGDIVESGQLLAVLDSRDLSLERLKWINQREERLREYSAALAKHDRASVRILAAQLEQAEAQLALVDEQIARTRIKAPFDGLIVSGDLSQSLSAPVERGQRLFQVAPLHNYRVVLAVDERDVAWIDVGQSGEIALAGLPGQALPLTVTRLTPVATTAGGRNHFRVEATIDAPDSSIRPGMEGIAKVHVDRRKRAWIWTYKLVDWVRMWAWSWWPS